MADLTAKLKKKNHHVDSQISHTQILCRLDALTSVNIIDVVICITLYNVVGARCMGLVEYNKICNRQPYDVLHWTSWCILDCSANFSIIHSTLLFCVKVSWFSSSHILMILQNMLIWQQILIVWQLLSNLLNFDLAVLMIKWNEHRNEQWKLSVNELFECHY